MSDNVKFFEENKYVVIPQALTGPIQPVLYEYVRDSAHRCKLIESDYSDRFPKLDHRGRPIREHEFGHFKDDQTMGDFVKYGDLLFDVLLLLLQRDVETATGLDLVPTYSYFRLYSKGTELRKHDDRKACEISISLCLGYTGEMWPLYMDQTPIYMKPGDMVIYRGLEIPHWRKPLEGEYHAQVFMHYNDVNGPIGTEWSYDTRPFIGLPTDLTDEDVWLQDN